MPEDGKLFVKPPQELSPLSAYVHIPFCSVRCGYCDFNTYTSSELNGVSQKSFSNLLAKEITLAQQVLKESGFPPRNLHSVFFGGGTPTQLLAEQLVKVLDQLREVFGTQSGAEITTEANPDTFDAAYAHHLADAGFTRVSIGMQSAVSHVLATLDRTHKPENVVAAVRAAQDAGLEVSVDLIYGTPGESLDDWRQSLTEAVSLGTNHISAYSLIVEEGTALERRIRRGEIATPDEDLQAEMYELADEILSNAGFTWYEISNWSKSAQTQSTHNLAYWNNHDWWGFGPGAHSHISGQRFWNVKHPAAYASRLNENVSPALAGEIPDSEAQLLEKLMLDIRLSQGITAERILPNVLHELSTQGLVEGDEVITLTLQGRLRADEIVRRIAFN